jgi:hypothetical protein
MIYRLFYGKEGRGKGNGNGKVGWMV